MLVAETVLGNIEEDPHATRYAERPETEIERVVLDDRERRRSRVRTTTEAGTDIGIVVDRNQPLLPGDVLVDDSERMVVVTFEDRDALVITFEGTEFSTDVLVQLTQLGYQVGNRHWDLAVRDDEVLVALGTDSTQKIREVTAALPSDAQTHREAVDPTLFDGTPGHGSGQSDGHTHDHNGHAHDHSHDHADHADHADHSHDGASHTHGEDSGHGIGHRTISTEETRERER
jgi:urease accessory protein